MNAPLYTSRRAWWATALCLAACSRSTFQSTEIEGADYGRHFRLQDGDGRWWTSTDFRGQVLLIFFGFTQCPDICPSALSRAAGVMSLLGNDAQKVAVVFVTLDPERDSPVVLREYARAFHPSFKGLRADLATTEATAKEFRVYYRKVPTGASYTMDHTALTFAYDPTGRLRLAIRHEQDMDSIAADVRLLLQGL
jgi:protein SCO1